MKKLMVVLLTVVGFTFSEQIPQGVRNAITEALNGRGIFESFDINKKTWGFDSTAKLSDVKAGEPFQMFFISQEKFERADENLPVCSLLISRDWYYAPLYDKGRLIDATLLISTRFGENGKWSSGMRTAKELVLVREKIKKVWPEGLGFHPELVLIDEPLLNSLCFFIPEKGDGNLTVVGTQYLTTKLFPDVNFTNLFSSRETLKSLREKKRDYERKSDSLWQEQTKKNDILVKKLEKKTEYLWKEREIRDNELVWERWKKMPVTNVTSWWENMLVQADSSIIPAVFKKKSIDTSTQTQAGEDCSTTPYDYQGGIILDSQIIKTAKPLRVGAHPIDDVVAAGQDKWYVLNSDDGEGFIRIGSTGPLIIDDAPYKEGEKWGNGGSHSETNRPQQNADLIEMSQLSITGMSLIWRVKNAYIKISTPCKKDVLYRISFVSELPEYRTGYPYGPGTVAYGYIMAVAQCDIKELYHTTRIHFTTEQAEKLRQKLFGTNNLGSFWQHSRPGVLEPNAEGKLHVQHIILSNEESISEGRHWAFRIICEKVDGLWLVACATRDPELSDNQIAEIVMRDMDNHKKR